jgi:hypothetical protein
MVKRIAHFTRLLLTLETLFSLELAKALLSRDSKYVMSLLQNEAALQSC